MDGEGKLDLFEIFFFFLKNKNVFKSSEILIKSVVSTSYKTKIHTNQSPAYLRE